MTSWQSSGSYKAVLYSLESSCNYYPKI